MRKSTVWLIATIAVVSMMVIDHCWPAEQPDIPTMQRAIIALQQQRNSALDAEANAMVQRAACGEDATALKAKVADLEKKLAEGK